MLTQRSMFPTTVFHSQRLIKLLETEIIEVGLLVILQAVAAAPNTILALY
jgi:hypothetical protein